MGRCLQKVRDEAGLLSPRQQPLGMLDVGAGRHAQCCTHAEFRELRDSLDPTESPLNVAPKREPSELRGTRDGAKGKHNTVRYCGDEERLGRPPIAWAVEFRGRSRGQRGKPTALQLDSFLRIRDRGDRVAMRKLLHVRFPLLAPLTDRRSAACRPCLQTRGGRAWRRGYPPPRRRPGSVKSTSRPHDCS